MKFTLVLQYEEDGVIVAEVPALPGDIPRSARCDEALDNIREAIVGYLGSLKAHGDAIPASGDEAGWKCRFEQFATHFSA